MPSTGKKPVKSPLQRHQPDISTYFSHSGRLVFSHPYLPPGDLPVMNPTP